MEYKILNDYFNNNKNMTISKLSRELNISRQTIYDWNEKGVIPKKYEKMLNNIGIVKKIINVEIEIELNYGKQFFILNCDKTITFDENGDLFVFEVDKYQDDKKQILSTDNYLIKKITGESKLKNIELNIIRYEAKIDFEKRRINYLLYCSNCEKNKYLDNRFTKSLFYKFKNDMKFNINEKNNFKDTVNYVKLNELDISFLVGREEMDLINKKFNPILDNFESIVKVMGMYLKYDDSMYDFLVGVLKEKFERVIEYYRGYYRYLNIIFICVDNIKDNINRLRRDYLDEMKKWSLTVRDDGVLVDMFDMFDIVFSHECGHLIFSYNRSSDSMFEERRANYFVSFIFDGKFDLYNLFLTNFQPYIYRNPLIKVEKQLIYDLENGINIFDSINKMYSKYHKEVLELYERK